MSPETTGSPDTPGSPDLRGEDWWETVSATALIGTGRRGLPPAPEGWPAHARPDAPAEVSLLDTAAVGVALRRAGRVPSRADPAAAAPPDRRPLAPARARQLLDLVLGQPPVGPDLQPLLLQTWLEAAESAGVRAHHSILPALLDLGAARTSLRPALVGVLDSRGRWLSTHRDRWRWAAGETARPHDDPDDALDGDPDDHPDDHPEADGSADLDAWSTRPTAVRAAVLLRLRRRDPDAGRALLETTWRADPAAVRSELLAVLSTGLGDSDESFLESALDDRAGGVRAGAAGLLEALPGSARAARLAARLAPLLSTSGMLRRKVVVELPEEPDGTGVRDGLGPAARGRSRRGHALEQLAAGAPLAVWTRTTGLRVDQVVATLDQPDALAGLRRAVLSQHDAEWAAALLVGRWDAALAALLPPSERERAASEQVGRVTTLADLVGALALLPAPWSPALSSEVVARFGRLERRPHELAAAVTALAPGLHPSVAVQLDALVPPAAGASDPVRRLATYLTLVPTITEAFT